MKSVLEEFYYGNIRPFANHRQEYENCASEITSKTECEIFIDGFQLGMRLALELLEM